VGLANCWVVRLSETKLGGVLLGVKKILIKNRGQNEKISQRQLHNSKKRLGWYLPPPNVQFNIAFMAWLAAATKV
jgi:hypothetical protein